MYIQGRRKGYGKKNYYTIYHEKQEHGHAYTCEYL